MQLIRDWTNKSRKKLTHEKRHVYAIYALSLILITFGIFFRFWHLSDIPLFYYHDEMDHVITGEAIARFGTDISGNWSPWQLKPLRTLNYTAELNAIWHALAQLFFGFGYQSGHIPNAFFGFASAILASYLLFLIFKNKLLFWLSLGIFLTNPLMIHLSRTAYETVISTFFQLVMITGIFQSLKMLKNKEKFKYNRKELVKLIAYVLLIVIGAFFAYFSYHGAKFTVLIILLSSAIFSFYAISFKKASIFSLGLIIIFIGLFSFSIHQSNMGYYGERDQDLFWNSEVIEKQINENRRVSLNYPAQLMFENKFIGYIQTIIKKYFMVYDFERLTAHGMESGLQFSLAVHGFFYISTILFLIFGIIYIFQKCGYKGLIAIFFLLLITPVASIINSGDQSIMRSTLSYFIILGVSSIGLWSIVYELKNRKNIFSLISIIIVISILSIELIFFSYKYFSRYPLVSVNNHYFNEELLAGYVKQAQDDIYIIADTPYSRSRSILSVNGLMPNLSKEQREQFAINNLETYDLGDVTVTQVCPNFDLIKNQTLIVELIKSEECKAKDWVATQSASRFVSLSSPLDSGTLYYVLNDKLCSEFAPNDFVYTKSLNMYNPAEITKEEFCTTWVAKP